MLPNVSKKRNNNIRRYSLFGGNNSNDSTNQAPLIPSPISNLFNQNCNSNNINDSLRRRRASTTIEMASNSSSTSSSVCQRCRRFEVDLTNTSDDLNAIDGELKASRQVISLLQRQLELLRVEKEGLEKLIISQSNNNKLQQQQQQEKEEFLLIDVEQQKIFGDIYGGSQTLGDNNGGSQQPLGETQKMLLSLIQTQLYVKDEEIVKLKFNLKETQNDKEQLMVQLHLLEEDNNRLKSENSVLIENLTLRDQTIVSLSNELFEQTNNSDEYKKLSNINRRQSVNGEAIGNNNLQTLLKTQRQLAKLIDTNDAYKKTNELLSNKVINLTDRCTSAEKKEIETRSQCQELEAKCCQIQSKLLSLLKEIEQSSKQQVQKEGGEQDKSSSSSSSRNNKDVICSESVTLLIKRLLEDKSLDIPLSWKEGNNGLGGGKNRNNFNGTSNKLKSSTKYECDELGFYIETYDDQEAINKSPSINLSSPNKLINKRNSLNELSPASTSRFNLPTVEEAIEANEQAADQSPSSGSSENLGGGKGRGVIRHLSVDSTKSDESRWHLKWDYFIKEFDKIDLTKSKEFKLLLRSGVPQEYRCKVWKALVDLQIGKDRLQFGQDYYQSLLQPNRPSSGTSKKSNLNPSSKQIELDLLRTLPNNKHFETLDSSGTVRLRRVLTAYSEHNPKVGYCQGMNRLAAVALLVLPEEEAFWCLATIVDKIMPHGYYNDLWLAQVDSAVVMDFVAIKMPNLSAHFDHYSIDLSLFAWFLTIFVDGTPPALFLRLWDSFLYEGDKILFRVALALLKLYENHLILFDNSVAVNNYLRSTVNEPMNIDHFFDIAFEWINPLSSRSLKSKRQHKLQLMKSGFEGRSFMTPSPTNSDDNNRYNSNKNDESPNEDSSIISI